MPNDILRRLLARWLAPAVLLLFAAGCETLYNAGMPGSGAFVDWQARDDALEDHRSRYQQDRDPAALRWLLVHQVRQGMTVESINQILGEEGEREFNDRQYKTKGGGLYHMGDECYRWGPDSEGHAVFLFFREGQLVNYKPEEYREAM